MECHPPEVAGTITSDNIRPLWLGAIGKSATGYVSLDSFGSFRWALQRRAYAGKIYTAKESDFKRFEFAVQRI
jgi:hypothetical protein